MNTGTANAVSSQPVAWSRYIPMLCALALVWLFARGLKKSFWTLVGMYWMVRWLW